MFDLKSSAVFDMADFCLQESLMAKKHRHETLERLFRAVAPLEIKGPSALAHAMRLGAEQIVTNWGTRGVSKEGALKAQRLFGVNAQWVLSGTGEMMVDAPARGSPRDAELQALSDDALEIGVYFDRLADKQAKTRAYVAIMNLLFGAERDAAAPAAPASAQPARAAPPRKRHA